MIKCFYTGIQLNENDAYLLDRAEARRLLRELRNKADVVENWVQNNPSTKPTASDWHAMALLFIC